MAKFEDFEDIMARNYGSMHFYTNILGKSFVYTEGVKDFAETFECYWFIDFIESYIPDIDKKFVKKNLYKTELMTSCTMDVLLKVKDNKAEVDIIAFGYDEKAEKEIETLVVQRKISFTDMPDGDYKLYLGAGDRYTLLLTSEY